MNFKIGDRVYVHGHVDEIRKDTIIIRNDGGYFGTIPSEVIREDRTSDYISRAFMKSLGAKCIAVRDEKTNELIAITGIDELPSAQPEPLTDKEQRIFLAAMEKEEKVCEEVDRNHVREPYEESLIRVCKEIRRKVKGALWT